MKGDLLILISIAEFRILLNCALKLITLTLENFEILIDIIYIYIYYILKQKNEFLKKCINALIQEHFMLRIALRIKISD